MKRSSENIRARARQMVFESSNCSGSASHGKLWAHT
jgi:hypothetical protein